MVKTAHLRICCLIHHEILFLDSNKRRNIEYGIITVWPGVTEFAELEQVLKKRGEIGKTIISNKKQLYQIV
jgi:hypothetical protein